MWTLRTIALTVAGGLLMAMALFLLTAPVRSASCPIGNGNIGTDFVCDPGGFDPWTGEFRTLTTSYTSKATGQRVTQDWGGYEHINDRAIPLPVGFVVGSLLTLRLIAARRTHRTASVTVRARTIALTVAGGLLMAVVLFALTATSATYLDSVGRPDGTNFVEDFGGSDAWTGEFRFPTWSWTDPTGTRVTQQFDSPAAYRSHRVIPLPVGFVVGSLLTLAVITAIQRPRKTASNSTVPAA